MAMLYLNEDLLFIHEPTEIPFHEKCQKAACQPDGHRRDMDQGQVSRRQFVRVFIHPTAHRVHKKINEEGIDAYDRKEPNKLLVAPDIDPPIEQGKPQKTPAAGCEYKGGGGDPFDDRCDR